MTVDELRKKIAEVRARLMAGGLEAGDAPFLMGLVDAMNARLAVESLQLGSWMEWVAKEMESSPTPPEPTAYAIGSGPMPSQAAMELTKRSVTASAETALSVAFDRVVSGQIVELAPLVFGRFTPFVPPGESKEKQTAYFDVKLYNSREAAENDGDKFGHQEWKISLTGWGGVPVATIHAEEEKEK